MKKYDLSIVIPSWKNPKYLKNCINSLLKNTQSQIQIIVYLNEDCSESRAYLQALNLENILVLSHPENVGICVAVNDAADQASAPYLVYLNDDMYALPLWDVPIMRLIGEREDDLFMYSGTMVEPVDTGNPAVVVADYGQSIESFDAASLEKNQKKLVRKDWSGSAWPPTVVSLRLWKSVGGYGLEYSPGFYSDPDLAMKMYQKGVRDFRGVGDSLIYHFAKVSTSRIPKGEGRRIFFCKWKMSTSTFYKYILRMGQDYTGPLAEPSIPLKEQIKNIWKRLTYKCPKD